MDKHGMILCFWRAPQLFSHDAPLVVGDSERRTHHMTIVHDNVHARAAC